ncbi:hypothetical protein WJN01_15015 [Flavobacteriaceae bacterium SZ-1-7]|uniref:hypothetical protein n=1 Tax=Tamlana sedimenti TaxID=3134126 RepID=UPI003122494F
MNKIPLYITLFLINSAIAQQTIKGKIDNYQSGEAEFILPVREPKAIGTIKANGKFTIELEDDMASEVTESQNKANAESQELRIKNNSVHEAFYCDSEEVKTTNGDLELESVTMQGNFFIGIIKDKKPIGKLRLASSKAFSESFFSYGKKDFVTGYYIDFYYVPEVASVKGICKTKTYTLDMKNTFDIVHNYDIDLKKGWNIVKIEVEEVYTDQEGHVRPLKFKMQTVDKIPKETKFIFSEGKTL